MNEQLSNGGLKIGVVIAVGRQYFVKEVHPGVWRAGYRPINPRTGSPWQAERDLEEGQDCRVEWQGDIRYPGGVLPVLPGTKTAEENVFQGRWSWICNGFSSKAKAEEACWQHIDKAKAKAVKQPVEEKKSPAKLDPGAALRRLVDVIESSSAVDYGDCESLRANSRGQWADALDRAREVLRAEGWRK